LYIYTDESGDLGWQFEPPYGQRGSSRYLTIFAACVPDEKCHHLERLVRNMYKASRWESGNSLHDYLQTTLWYEAGVSTVLHATSTDSKQCRGLQFADFMAGAIAARFEYARHQYLATPGLRVNLRKLYF